MEIQVEYDVENDEEDAERGGGLLPYAVITGVRIGSTLIEAHNLTGPVIEWLEETVQEHEVGGI